MFAPSSSFANTRSEKASDSSDLIASRPCASQAPPAFGGRLQDIEQAPPVNAAHAVAAGDYHLAAVVDVDIVPVAKAGEDVAVRLGVGFAQVVQRGIREHHPAAEGG